MDVRPVLSPLLDGLDPEQAHRVLMTIACRDADTIPKVADAGAVSDVDGVAVQVMHNGVYVEAGGYFGAWMQEIIRCLRGHHEPQEERVFHEVLTRLADDGAHGGTMLELGSYWAYYGLWFSQVFPGARVIALEPDPAFLQVGRRNFALNGRDAVFVAGAIGAGTDIDFRSESDGMVRITPTYTVRDLMDSDSVERIDLLLADVQGAERDLLASSKDVFEAGRVRFVIISTHHFSISGSALTHQETVESLRAMGAHIIAEHSVGESFSGDGLVAASFDDRDRDFTVRISHARQRESLFGELEYALNHERYVVGVLTQDLAAARAELSAARESVEQARAALDDVRSSKTWMWSASARRVYGRVRTARRGDGLSAR